MILQTFYERYTGEKHTVLARRNRLCEWEVRVDGEFYATAENGVQAEEEIVDILRHENWTPICPI